MRRGVALAGQQLKDQRQLRAVMDVAKKDLPVRPPRRHPDVCGSC
jgi:hypothetical protein